jgi:toxin-antitoxin system PIN domain toxin
VLIDTNVLLYAVNESSEEFSQARKFLVSRMQGSDPLHITWINIYEFLRVATHPKIFDRPLRPVEAWGNIASLVDHPNCVILQETPQHGTIVKEIVAELSPVGNFWHDCHIAATMKENGVDEIATCDMDFRKFPFLKIINPLQ